jgi:acetyl-CoA C-acetyltransferase
MPLAQAGLSIHDMDLRQIYGAYPYTQCSALEGYGVCEDGHGAKLWAEGRCGPGGDLPCTTMGDATGRGHTGQWRQHGVLSGHHPPVAR